MRRELDPSNAGRLVARSVLGLGEMAPYRHLVALGLFALHFACTPAASSDDEGQGLAAGTDGDGAGPSGGQGGAGGEGEGAATSAAIGVVVVDIQETFVDSASNPDIDAILDRAGALFGQGATYEVPFFITFEASQSGSHALHSSLQPVVPSHAQLFTKTTFAATGLDAFATATTSAGLTHLVVIGAETDVCVLQTALGLRALGFEVMLQRSAVFSEELNVGPALRRMEQAGVRLVTASEVEGYLADPSTLPPAAQDAVRVVRPLEMGVVLNDLSNAQFTAVMDPDKTAKVARLRELLLVSEWFELPVYVEDVSAGLPAELEDYFWGTLRPLDQIASDAGVTQLVFAGTQGDVSSEISAWLDAREVFVMEDALLGGAAPLTPLFAAGLVPTTYKTFYYDMTQSIDFSEWPSQAWAERADVYYDLTQAPEDLPPIDPD